MTTALAGGHLLEDIEGVITGIQSKDWIDTALSAGVGALETAAFVIDPIGQGLAAGVSWLIEHVPALNEPLHHLTGDIAALNAHASDWDRTAAGLHEQDRFLNDRSATLAHDWTGASADAFQGQIGLRRLAIRCAGFGARAIALALRAGAIVVQAGYVLVRDTLAQISGGTLGAALKTLASGGILAPVAVAQIGTAVQAVTAKVSALVVKVGASIGRLISKYLNQLKNLIDSIMRNVKKVDHHIADSGKVPVHPPLAGHPPMPVKSMGSHYIGEQIPDNKIWFGSHVHYLSERELAQHRLVSHDGKLYDTTGKLFDTSESALKGHAIYVMDDQGNLYASNYHEVGQFHHSSFLGGKPVAGAGHITVKDGEVVMMDNKSGHYTPGKEFADRVKNELIRQGVQLKPGAFRYFGF